MSDSFSGTLTFVRVYSGTLRTGETLYNASQGKRERVGKLVLMHANKREEVEEVQAGEIAAVMGLRFTRTGDTLCSEGKQLLLEKIDFPEPVISVAIEPKTKADQEKLGDALTRLGLEDPSFRITTQDETGQTLMSGMGELHLEILVDRLKREFKVDANVGKPQVAYRETVQATGRAEGKFAKFIGGKNQFAEVVLEVSPRERGAGYRFQNLVPKGVLPDVFVQAVDRGVQETCLAGLTVGYPVVDVEVKLLRAALHETDSTEVAFKIAASMAFKGATLEAGPIILEPVMSCEVLSPEEFVGGVIGDLNSRRGKILSMSTRQGLQAIRAEVPLATMFGYSTAVRSASQGRASFSMEFARYERVSPAIEAEIKAQTGYVERPIHAE
jgi:elongation factor G